MIELFEDLWYHYGPEYLANRAFLVLGGICVIGITIAAALLGLHKPNVLFGFLIALFAIDGLIRGYENMEPTTESAWRYWFGFAQISLSIPLLYVAASIMAQ